MPNMELGGVSVSASNPVPISGGAGGGGGGPIYVGSTAVTASGALPVYEVLAPAQTINRRIIAAATGLSAASAVSVPSNAGRQAIIFNNTSGANAYLAGAGFLPTYSASDANAIWDVKIPAGATIFMDRAAMLPGVISVTFDGSPTGYLRSSEVSS